MLVLTFALRVDAHGKCLSIVLISTPFEFPLMARHDHLNTMIIFKVTRDGLVKECLSNRLIIQQT